jgi:Domain of unknown function (DUF222)
MSQSPCDDDDDDDEPAPPWNALSQDRSADVPPPGPELIALLGGAVANVGQLDGGQLLGTGSAARRLQAHAQYLEIVAVAEFARLRAEQLEASKARGDRVRSRDGEYPAEELGFEMTASAYSAAILIDMAQNIVGRLPSTLAGMAAGVIDRDRARVISNATLHLPDDLAAEADKVLAQAAPEMKLADLQKKAARLEVRLDPEGVQKRKDEARHDRRVELRREDSGAASLAGRELDPAEAMAGKASIDADAVRLRNAGLPGTLAQIRAVILMDRIHQRSPWDRLAPPPTEPQPEPDGNCDGGCDDRDGIGCDGACGDGRDPAASPDASQPSGRETDADRSQPADPEVGPPDDPLHDDPDHHDPDPDDPYDGDPYRDDPYDDDPYQDGQFPDADESDDEEEDEGRPAGFTGGAPPGSPGDRTGRKTPMPALINITIPAGTLLGWSNAPADVGTWGLMDADAVRDLIEAASRHPRTRWCYTLTGQDDQAIAHACARGSHSWPPPLPSRDEPSRDLPSVRIEQLNELLARLNAAPEPIARGTCDHAHREDRYIPSRKLKHLIRARTARCCAPGCGAQAITSEIDHTIPHPAGATCEDNLSPQCRRHHHAKHAPGWKLQQTQPGIMRWTTPSGRAYTTHPTRYEE